jgi:hypothetical protein
MFCFSTLRRVIGLCPETFNLDPLQNHDTTVAWLEVKSGVLGGKRKTIKKAQLTMEKSQAGKHKNKNRELTSVLALQTLGSWTALQ